LLSEPRLIVLTSLVFGAVVIGAYVSQRDNDWSSGQDASLVADNERGLGGARVAAGPGEGQPGATLSAQALRRRALRDDVAASRTQPNMSIGAQAGDALAIAALELARQTNREQQMEPTPQAAPKSNVKANRTQTPSTARTEHAHPGRVASAEHTKGKPGATKRTHSTQGVATTSGSGHARGGNHSSSSSAERSAKTAASVAPQPWSLPQDARQDAEPSATVSRSGFPAPAQTQAVANNGPKTRAEVQAELAHARESGTLPEFGKGPGAH
jgi:hypothetical protein